MSGEALMWIVYGSILVIGAIGLAYYLGRQSRPLARMETHIQEIAGPNPSGAETTSESTDSPNPTPLYERVLAPPSPFQLSETAGPVSGVQTPHKALVDLVYHRLLMLVFFLVLLWILLTESGSEAFDRLLKWLDVDEVEISEYQCKDVAALVADMKSRNFLGWEIAIRSVRDALEISRTDRELKCRALVELVGEEEQWMVIYVSKIDDGKIRYGID